MEDTRPYEKRAEDAVVASIVIINYNGQAHLAGCLAALFADDAFSAFEVIVVDNASSDGSASLATQFVARFPGRVRIIMSPTNRGYAGGFNVGLAESRGPYAVALNPDVRVTAGWLAPLVAFMDGHPHVAAVSPLIVLKASGRINAAGQSVHVTGLGFNRMLWQPAEMAGRSPHAVSGIHGAAVMIRRTALQSAGGWDETGFLYHEDVELSWLLHMHGYGLYCIPESVVEHDYYLTMYPQKLFLLERNRLAMLLAHLKRRSLFILSPLLVLTESMMWAYCFLRGSAFLSAKAASYRWVWQRRAMWRSRRRALSATRRCGDAEVLRKLAWNYAWSQFLSLGRERGISKRQPTGGMPAG